MATVGAVLAALRGLDPELPVGALRVERHGEITLFDVGDVVELHVEADRVTGRPLAAWAVVGVRSADTPVDVPLWWTVRRSGCGCVASVPVIPGRSVSTLGAPCSHYVPPRPVGPLGSREPPEGCRTA